MVNLSSTQRTLRVSLPEQATGKMFGAQKPKPAKKKGAEEMSFDHWVAIAITAFLALGLWICAALLPVPIRPTANPKPISFLALRDEHKFVYWVTMGVHSAVTAFVWWLPLTGRMTT